MLALRDKDLEHPKSLTPDLRVSSRMEELGLFSLNQPGDSRVEYLQTHFVDYILFSFSLLTFSYTAK